MSYTPSSETNFNLRTYTVPNVGEVDFVLGGSGKRFTAISPINNQTGVVLSPLIDWSDSDPEDVDAYLLLIGTDPNLSNPIIEVVVFDQTSYQITEDLDSNTTYYWKVIPGSEGEAPEPPPEPDPAPDQINTRAGDEESLRLHAEALAVGGWYDSTGWSADSMSLEDEIYGVIVDTIDGELRVVEIDLMSNNLRGTLPEFPGLQHCWRARFKQIETGGDPSQIGQRITGPIPDSWGNNTKCTMLSFAGRLNASPSLNGTPADRWALADEEPGGYNMKFARAWNQFSPKSGSTNGVPDSLYNLKLKRLEIDGQNSQFQGTLKSGCANWEITHIWATGNSHYVNGESAFFGAMPSETKNWVNCVRFHLSPNEGITFWPDDCFEGWNNLVRVIALGGEHTQQFPSMTGLTKVLEIFTNNILFTDEYPLFFHDFEFIRTFNFVPHLFVDDRDLSFELSNINQTYGIGLSSASPIKGLTGSLFTGPETGYRGIIAFDLRQNQNLRNIITEGVWRWSALRYYRAQGTGGSTLPSRPPGEFGASLRGIYFQQSAMIGSLTSDWKNAGSIEDRGGIYATGNVSDFDSDGLGEHWIEDENANYTTDELVGMSLRHITGSGGTTRRAILSNTANRIYYRWWSDDLARGFNDMYVGAPYEITRNTNTDNRAFNQNISLNNNFLKGAVPVDVAPLHLMGNSYNISLNLFRMKDIAPAVANMEKRSRMNWLFIDPRTTHVHGTNFGATSSGDVTFTFNGNSVVIAINASNTPDQQAQAIADAINNDASIELSCEFISSGKALVFDTPLTGIEHAFKEIEYNNGGTGLTFESIGYTVSYAPQGRLSERPNYQNSSVKPQIPAGYEIPHFFLDETIIVASGAEALIDFSDEAYAGNTYTWYRKLNGESSFSLMAGETGNQLAIADFQSDNEGEYYMEIANPDAPAFTGENAMRSATKTLTL
jgi:hypothetical protein